MGILGAGALIRESYSGGPAARGVRGVRAEMLWKEGKELARELASALFLPSLAALQVRGEGSRGSLATVRSGRDTFTPRWLAPREQAGGWCALAFEPSKGSVDHSPPRDVTRAPARKSTFARGIERRRTGNHSKGSRERMTGRVSKGKK